MCDFIFSLQTLWLTFESDLHIVEHWNVMYYRLVMKINFATNTSNFLFKHCMQYWLVLAQRQDPEVVFSYA